MTKMTMMSERPWGLALGFFVMLFCSVFVRVICVIAWRSIVASAWAAAAVRASRTSVSGMMAAADGPARP